MQVTFDPAQLGRRGVHRLGAGLGQPPDERRHFLPGGGQQGRGHLGVGLQRPRSADHAERQRAQQDHLPPETRRCRAPPSEHPGSAITRQCPRAGHHQGRGHQPEHHANRHVGQRPQQIPPGRGVGQQPLAALQPPDQSVGHLDRPWPVGRHDRHPRPLQRPAALRAGQPPHGQQAHRREQHPDPGRQGDDAEHGDDEQRGASQRVRGQGQSATAGQAGPPGQPAEARAIAHRYLPRRSVISASIVWAGGTDLGGVNPTFSRAATSSACGVMA